MIPVRQRIVDAQRGDCLKACVASVLELPYEDVPHFAVGEWKLNPMTGEKPKDVGWSSALNDWLLRGGWPLRVVALYYHRRDLPSLPKGKTRAYLDHFELSDYPRHSQPGYWIASVVSANIPGVTHAVVMLDHQVAFDPSPRQRRVPYAFLASYLFVATDIARVKPEPLPPLKLKARSKR